MDHNVNRSAAALTYYMIFSLFPLLALASNVLSYLQLSPDWVSTELQGILPAQVIDIVATFLNHVNENSSGTLFWFSLVLTVYFPMRAIDYMMESIRVAYGAGNFRKNLRYLLILVVFAVSFTVTLLAALALLLLGEELLTIINSILPEVELSLQPWISLRFLYLAAIVFVVLCLLYWLGPGTRPRIRHILPGAAAATAAMLIISMGFSFYVENVSNYSLLYGSIGAIIVLLLWLYFASITILMGAEFNRALARVRGE